MNAGTALATAANVAIAQQPTASSDENSVAPENQLQDDTSEDDSEDFDSFESSSINEIALENARGTIDKLYRLSFRIRNTLTRTGFTRAKHYRQIDKDTNVDLIEQYELQDLRHVEEVLSQMQNCRPHDCSNKYLIKRLAAVNTRRRQQFGQWKSHKEKFERAQEPFIQSEGGDNVSQSLRNVNIANASNEVQRLE